VAVTAAVAQTLEEGRVDLEALSFFARPGRIAPMIALLLIGCAAGTPRQDIDVMNRQRLARSEQFTNELMSRLGDLESRNRSLDDPDVRRDLSILAAVARRIQSTAPGAAAADLEAFQGTQGYRNPTELAAAAEAARHSVEYLTPFLDAVAARGIAPFEGERMPEIITADFPGLVGRYRVVLGVPAPLLREPRRDPS
jgi:hypothetical protein